jgi:phosphate transport system substrate-binding protein
MSTSTPNTSASDSSSGTKPSDSLSSPQRRRSGQIGTATAAAIAVVLLIGGFGGGYVLEMELHKSTSTKVQITETGSSLLYPLMTAWAGGYTAATLSAASTGSGTGQTDANEGTVNIGASDGYLTAASADGLINVPVAISAQLIAYNLPSITGHLNLNGSVLAEIFNGTITTWDDPLILNAQSSGVQTELKALSSETIYPIDRSDASGDTFIFTSYCDMSWSKWKFGYGTANLTGDTAVFEGGNGNVGVLSDLSTQANSIGYVGISYNSTVKTDKLGYAALGDASALSASGGTNSANYVLPSAQNISADANLGLNQLSFSPTNQLEISLIMGGSPGHPINIAKGKGGTAPTSADPHPYPITNLEYTLIKTAPTGKTVTSSALAATVAFLEWAISIGNFATNDKASTYIQGVNFIPLTPEVAGYDMQELAWVQA